MLHAISLGLGDWPLQTPTQFEVLTQHLATAIKFLLILRDNVSLFQHLLISSSKPFCILLRGIALAFNVQFANSYCLPVQRRFEFRVALHVLLSMF